MNATSQSQSVSWQTAQPTMATGLEDARLQVHHAAQLASAFGISYLPPASDDSHTNLAWNPVHAALISRDVPSAGGAVTVGLRVRDLTLFVSLAGHHVAEIALHARTLGVAADLLRNALGAAGLASGRYTLERHFTLPTHPVAGGLPFNAGDAAAFNELSTWFANAALELTALASRETEASEVRVWPHHFDMATLITLPGGRSVGAGMEPGDAYYAEPYFYVNAYPAPDAARLTMPLGGGGTWHTHEWTGAVLPVSRLPADPAAQQAHVRAFLDSAVTACRSFSQI